MQPHPFLRTFSKSQHMPSYGHESPEVKGGPQHVVVGFHLGSENSKRRTDACESPRSVLEPSALCVSDNPERLRSPRSPRSVLGSLLLGQGSHHPCTGVGLGGVADSKGEEAYVFECSSCAPVKSKPVAISEQNEIVCACKESILEGSFTTHPSAFFGGAAMGDECYDLDVDEDHVTGCRESIFCAASPFSTCCSLVFPTQDFLSVCFLCKCRLTDGEDVYMYKGDKAFCSAECRYQQIVIDEFKERQSAAASCFMGASARDSKMLTGASAAVS